MMKAYKYRLYPSVLQETALEEHLDLTRELYNAALQERRDAYRKRGVSRSFYDQKKTLPEVKEARPEFASQVHAHVLQGTLQQLDRAFGAFFRRVGAGETPGYPRFKGRGWWDSFAYQECSTPLKDAEGQTLGWKWTTCGRPDEDAKRINLPKIGKVKVVMHRPLEGRPKTLVIKREGTEWYAVYTCEVQAQVLPGSSSCLGLDLGTRYLYTDSEGSHCSNPGYLARGQRKIAAHSQSLSRKKKGSKRRHEARRCLKKAHLKVARQRLDHAHKTAKGLVQKHGTIVVEDLKPSRMVHGPSGLSRSIYDAGWSTFISVLSLKAESAGRTVLKVAPEYTSQRCLACGYVDKANRKGETFACLACGHADHADVNAAKNIRELGADPSGYAARTHRGRVGPAGPARVYPQNSAGGSPSLLLWEAQLPGCPVLQGGE